MNTEKIKEIEKEIEKKIKKEKNDFVFDLGERLYNLRTDKRYTLNKAVTEMQLHEIDITEKTLSHYECGTSKIDVYKLAKIADFYSVSTDYLLNGTESETDEDISRLINRVPKQLQPFLLNMVKSLVDELNRYCAEK